MELDQTIYHKILIIKIDIMNGSLFIQVILRMKNKPMLILNGEIVKITWNIKTSIIIQLRNSLSLLERMFNSQDSMVKLHKLSLMLVKEHSKRATISLIQQMLSNLIKEVNQFQKLTQLNQLLMIKLNMEANLIIMHQVLIKHYKEAIYQLNMVMDFG